MKRIQEKIKDLVDVRNYETIKNYTSDTTATVAAYHFTDVTSELMAKWLDEIVEITNRSVATPSGAARALAGNRGVGKSHFLAVLGALMAHSDLRTRLTDQHVGLSAQRLARQKYSVVNVERGLGETLTDEFRYALRATFGENPNFDETSVSAGEMLKTAAALTGDLPLIVIIDSAYDRKARVKRDDGAVLGEMAEIAYQTRTFLAIALDDDIAGADGVNAAIARTCAIDYLDQEHLYRIVDAFIYQKRVSAGPILRELYQEFRRNVPGFNWSEPRFASLYPIHPIVVDITPAVRLYAPKFAFLPFAAENAIRVLGRPAHSLLALDEVFDRVEPELRKAVELEETFEVYDELATGAISQIPIMQRLQAKLILKGLLLTSLDGRGATARELGAAMLIYDESLPLSAIQKIQEIIVLFAGSVDEGKVIQIQDNGEVRYSLGNSVAADFESKLAEVAKTVEPEANRRVLRLGGASRFTDWTFGDFGLGNAENFAELTVNWRGSSLTGRIVWQTAEENQLADNLGENLDWQLVIVSSNENASPNSSYPDNTIVWQPAALRSDEEETLQRFAALLTDDALAEEFSETAIAAEQTTAAIVERIWTRIFLEQGKLIVAETFERPFAPEAVAAQTLTGALEIALAPFFAERFPEHPRFNQTLTMTEVSQIVSDLLGGANSNSPETQRLAQTFALPLGIAAGRGTGFILETDENLLKLPIVNLILAETDRAGGAPVLLRELFDKLKQPPYGLQRETVNLLFAALVARRRLEFVTSNNDRITHRSLNLQIIWSDLMGVAKSSKQPRSSAELANWASQLTGVKNLTSLDAELEKITDALRNWFSEWQSAQVLANFDELPDEVLNVRAWQVVSHVERSFGVAAEAIRDYLENEMSLEDALETVIDAFGNEPETIAESRLQFAELECFIQASKLRQTVWRYIARSEITADPAIETLRNDLLAELNITENAFDLQASRDFESIWLDFRRLYTDFYVEQHNSVMHSTTRLDALEYIEQSAEYVEFLGLAGLPFAHPRFLEKAHKLREAIKSAKCGLDTRQILQNQPHCTCGMRLIRAQSLERLPQDLANTMQHGRITVRRILAALSLPLSNALKEIAAGETNEDYALRAQSFAEIIKRGGELPVLSPLDLRLLAQATPRMPVPTMRVRVPRGLGALPLEDMRLSLNMWLDNLPNVPVLVKLLEDE